MRKVVRRRIVVGFIGAVIVVGAALTPIAVSASYISDHSDNAADIEAVWELYTAASHCLGSPGRESYSIRLSGNRDGDSAQNMKNFYNLNSGWLFKGKKDADKIYSATLEAKYKGYKDGKLYCSEANYILDLLKMIGKYDETTRNQIICDKENPGIFSVESGYGPQLTVQDDDKKPSKDWPSFKGDCSGNLNKLIEYVEQRPNESIPGWNSYDFYIKLKPSKNAASHFQKVLDSLIGRFDADGVDRDMMYYWCFYNAFEAGCGAINNGNTTVPATSTTNMIGIYDAKMEELVEKVNKRAGPKPKTDYDIRCERSKAYAQSLLRH